jgi:hypothetical protein
MGLDLAGFVAPGTRHEPGRPFPSMRSWPRLLLSRATRFVNGAALRVDGGQWSAIGY